MLEKIVISRAVAQRDSLRGFTLIELLIVIAVLGVLAAVVMVAINPLEQLARGRDAGRKNDVSQLGSAVQSYYTSHNATWFAAATPWIQPNLVTSGELKQAPAAIPYSLGGVSVCATNADSQYCYRQNGTGTEVAVYTRLESSSEKSKCAAGVPFFTWDSSLGRACLVCFAGVGDPTVGTACNAVQ